MTSLGQIIWLKGSITGSTVYWLKHTLGLTNYIFVLQIFSTTITFLCLCILIFQKWSNLFHQSIWKLIEKMQKYEALSQTKLRNHAIGKEAYRRKEQAKKDAELKNVVSKYLDDVKNKKEDLLGTLDLIVDALRGFYNG